MVFELSDVKKVLDAFRDGDWDRIHLRDDDSELLLSIYDENEALTAEMSFGSTTAPTSSGPTLTTPLMSPATPSPATPSRAAAPAAALSPGAVEVSASSMGIFWRSPSPGAPPFVSVGDAVTEETTLCIIEVMKLMHRVPAGVRGTVVQVIGTNGEPVETGEVLFRINPLG
jgi:acetyl-CoA carboxylase biotin carboxyl carrier protein